MSQVGKLSTDLGWLDQSHWRRCPLDTSGSRLPSYLLGRKNPAGREREQLCQLGRRTQQGTHHRYSGRLVLGMSRWCRGWPPSRLLGTSDPVDRSPGLLTWSPLDKHAQQRTERGVSEWQVWGRRTLEDMPGSPPARMSRSRSPQFQRGTRLASTSLLGSSAQQDRCRPWAPRTWSAALWVPHSTNRCCRSSPQHTVHPQRSSPSSSSRKNSQPGTMWHSQSLLGKSHRGGKCHPVPAQIAERVCLSHCRCRKSSQGRTSHRARCSPHHRNSCQQCKAGSPTRRLLLAATGMYPLGTVQLSGHWFPQDTSVRLGTAPTRWSQ